MKNDYDEKGKFAFQEDLKNIDERVGSLYVGVDKFGDGLFRSDEEGFYFYLKKYENHLSKELSGILKEGEISQEEMSFDNLKVFPRNIRDVRYIEGKPLVYLNVGPSKI